MSGDAPHMSGGNQFRLTPEILSKTLGFTNSHLRVGLVVTLAGDLLFLQGVNQPKLPLVPQSETTFMSTATPDGFPFVKDAQVAATHLIRLDGTDQQKATRKR